jgi:hypothetical protein
VEIPELPVGQHELYLPLALGTKYEVQLWQPNLRYSPHCMLSSSAFFFILFIPPCWVSYFRGFCLSWSPIVTPLFRSFVTGSDESGWSRMTGESAFSTFVLLRGSLSPQSSSAFYSLTHSQALQPMQGLGRLKKSPPTISILGLDLPISDSQPPCIPHHSIHLSEVWPLPFIKWG